ncbi:hypothetical protein L226DRAFT_531128 [Lentinus tigrinus ALCF2SS1-7]|uniref:Uncharacterized protein n=1 Tax=Lentinus tigrinus ALCF2SS1-6 TaxID=1328759 RepID=A0A5C2SQB2_9APHY|nr:hypothetical protein L227DRAFT_606821 [Lentinus tigrinus ALCF2SS1-6]RPD79311.1 hypothetical protein L226DRAFT_531128 [Lentinus tigrinus ALCF2SS1-7]
MAGSDQVADVATNEALQLRAIANEIARSREEYIRDAQKTDRRLEEMTAKVNEMCAIGKKLHEKVRELCEALRQQKAEGKAAAV